MNVHSTCLMYNKFVWCNNTHVVSMRGYDHDDHVAHTYCCKQVAADGGEPRDLVALSRKIQVSIPGPAVSPEAADLNGRLVLLSHLPEPLPEESMAIRHTWGLDRFCRRCVLLLFVSSRCTFICACTLTANHPDPPITHVVACTPTRTVTRCTPPSPHTLPTPPQQPHLGLIAHPRSHRQHGPRGIDRCVYPNHAASYCKHRRS